MEMDVFRGGDKSSHCAPGIASPGVRVAFDLQLFNEPLELVHEVEGKVTLDLALPEWVSQYTTYDVTDGEPGHVYGTILPVTAYLTLASPPEGAPIEAVVTHPTIINNDNNYVNLENCAYLGETVACKAIGRDGEDRLAGMALYYGDSRGDNRGGRQDRFHFGRRQQRQPYGKQRECLSGE